jgi:hypothetical protein
MPSSCIHGYTSRLIMYQIIFYRCNTINAFTLYPWVHQWTNNVYTEDQTTSCKFPDVNPADLPPNSNFSMAAGDFLEIYTDPGMQNSYVVPVILKVYWSWMDRRASKGVWITWPNINFTGHAHTPQRRCSDSYWSFGPVINNLILDQTNIYWTLPHVRWTLVMTSTLKPVYTERPWEHTLCSK